MITWICFLEQEKPLQKLTVVCYMNVLEYFSDFFYRLAFEKIDSRHCS